MNGLGPLLRKELGAIFLSPVAYAVIAMFVILMSYTFCAQLFHSRSASLAPMLFQAATLLLLTIPLLTMRQFAEERRNGTLELLLSTPVDDLAVVLAKFLATLSVIGVLLVLLLALPLTLGAFSSPDWGPIASGYIGLLLLAAALTSIGLAVSTVTSNQLVAAALTLGLFLLFWMAEVLGVLFRAPFDEIAIALSLDTRFTPFATGAVYLSDFGFFLTVGLVGLLLSVAGLSRR
ncbi:MAG: ABC-2 type transport system permease protein [Gammaproteobacteria bacterium]